jgi:pSer/pThr/pTyr-binding forkhead associated (FHA) protein
MGEFGIQARLVKPAATEREEAAQGDLGATMVYSAAKPAERAGEAAPQEKVETRALLQMNGKTFVIDRPRTVIGRSSRCDFVVDDPNVSRRHAELQRRGGDWYVVDLDSTNGVVVNGKPVRSAALAPGDEIALGTARLRFNVD